MPKLERLTPRMIFRSLMAATGGGLLGYCTAVISGALLFVAEEFHLSHFMQGFLVSIILLGGLAGAWLAAPLADWLGRRKTLFLNGAVYLIGSVIVIFSYQFSSLVLGRFITGLGVGISSMIIPLYIAEIAPARWRGALVALNQLMITVGILAAYLVNYAFSAKGQWRWMFGIALLPAIIQMASVALLPEASFIPVEERKKPKKLWTIKHALIIGLILSALQQITGVNAVLYYASTIFQMAGYTSPSSATFVTLLIGGINVIATLGAIWLLDHKGRRWLLLWGAAGMCVSLLIMSAGLLIGGQISTLLSPISLMAYVSAFAIGLGSVTWVFLSEIYPLPLRGRAMSLAMIVNWLSNYFVSLVFRDTIATWGMTGTFLAFSFLSLVTFLFVLRYLPETKGKTLDEIQEFFDDIPKI